MTSALVYSDRQVETGLLPSAYLNFHMVKTDIEKELSDPRNLGNGIYTASHDFISPPPFSTAVAILILGFDPCLN